jgi:capsid portal protein
MKNRLLFNQSQNRANKQLDIFAITNDIQSYSVRSNSIYSGDVINYGLDNLYPNEVFDIVQDSPTAGGCVKRKSEFVFGKGVESDIVVNRHNKTINDVISVTCQEYAKYNGFALHFNYNLMGQIIEIQNVDLRYVRKMKDMLSVVVGKIKRDSKAVNLSGVHKVEIALYQPSGIKKYIKKSGGFKKFKGAVYYFNNNSGIYPVCTYDSALTSAQFEQEAQVFSYMNVKNGFSSSGVLKIPDMPDDEKAKKEMEEKIKKVVGSQNAGSMLVIEAPRELEGGIQASKLFEPFQTQDVDKVHDIQSSRAKDYILRAFNMPEILLGVSNEGMFNQESFQDAFNYYNNDTKRDRIKIEKAYNQFWGETSFSSELSEIEIIPLDEMTKNGEDNASNNVE